ncbi:MAG TPA: MBL fold metallo-hydrolase [Actinomycetota bacterium]|nr:MBL fold metallo-hydrolase [Actinomycetota bacterium]
MELIVLGAHGTWPSAGGATSGLLIRHEGRSLVLDLGSGTVAKLQEHVDLFEPHGVLISHSHPDHVSDLYTYLLARLFAPERPPLIPLYLAPKVLERFTPLLADDSGPMRPQEAFDVVEVEPGTELTLGPFTIRTAPMLHSVPTLGIRVEAGGAAVAYSADTGPSDELVRLSRGCDLLVAEASWQTDGIDRPPIHLTAREAGEMAARAGCGRLMLTHIRPHLDRDRSRDEAGGTFGGEILLAAEGLTVEVKG